MSVANLLFTIDLQKLDLFRRERGVRKLSRFGSPQLHASTAGLPIGLGRLFIAWLVLVFSLVSRAQAAAPPDAGRFLSPDGTRAVRLNLLGMSPKAEPPPGMNKELFDAARKRGPSLRSPVGGRGVP